MTEKQQQIVEMAKDICRVQHNCNDPCNPISACDALKYAERAVEAGYSKQSEVAREIFEEIETSLQIMSFHGSEVYYAIRAEDYLHYKKKYTEGEK